MSLSRLALVLSCVTIVGAADDAAALWKDKVQPLFAARCYECHGEKKAKHDLRLDSKAAILKGGKELGPAVIAGKPEESPLLKLCLLKDGEEDRMPAKGNRLSDQKIAWIRAWITGGAPMVDAPVPAK